MSDKRFALLIDAENISAKYIDCILDEMTKHGVITYKRIYGDWTDSHTSKWKEVLIANSIIPVQQFSNTWGKNASDSTLIIDAMDILYTNHVDGFCIISSDSDFTRLATRLRESGMVVIGMGEKKTPRSFRAACTLFTDLNILLDSDNDDGKAETPTAKTEVDEEKNVTDEIEKSDIENVIAGIIRENVNNGKETGLGEIGSRLVNKYPDFDVRNYGYSLLSKFLSDVPALELKKSGHTITVCLKDQGVDEEKIKKYVLSALKEAGGRGLDVSELSNKVHIRFTGFRVKDYGYSRFSKFVQNMQGVEVQDTNAKNKKRVILSAEKKTKNK